MLPVLPIHAHATFWHTEHVDIYFAKCMWVIVAFVLEYRLINIILTYFLTFSNAHINPYLIWCSFLCIQPCVLTCMLTVSLTHIRTLFPKLLKAFILTVSVTHIRAAWHVFLTAFSGIYSYNDPDHPWPLFRHRHILLTFNLTVGRIPARFCLRRFCPHRFWKVLSVTKRFGFPQGSCRSEVQDDQDRICQWKGIYLGKL